MVEMVRIFGRFSDRWWYKWDTRARYFHEDAIFKEDSTPAMGERRIVDLKERVQMILGAGYGQPAENTLEAGVWQRWRRSYRPWPEERIGAEETLQLLPASWGQGFLG